MQSMTRKSSGRSAGIALVLSLFTLSCGTTTTGSFVPVSGANQDQETSIVQPEPPAEPPLDPAPPRESPDDSSSSPAPGTNRQWVLSSPSPGSTSADPIPRISGNGFEDGSTVIVYRDAACSVELGRATAANGRFAMSSKSLKTDGSDDGAIQFFARIGSEACQDLGLGYVLNTRTPESGTMYHRLIAKGDASTSIVIGFHATTTRAADHTVHYDTEDHGRDASAYGQSATPAVIHAYNQMNNAFVRLNGLKPDRAYYFVIVDPKGTSKRYWFKTAPATDSQRLSVIAGGDSRNNRTPRKNANILVSKLRPHFVMFGGDMTGGGSASEWKEWFSDWELTTGADGRMIPIVPARGNHESSNEMLEKLFDTPSGVYYGTSFGGDLLRVYTLNSESGVSGAQTTWLQSDLAANTHVQWKFAQYHRPMRPHTKDKGDATSLYTSWAEVFHSHRVNLVSECDAHVVKSTWPVRPSTDSGSSQGFIRDDQEGTVYVGEGGWGAPLRANNDDKPWTRASGRFNHFNWILVDKNKTEVRFVKVDNAAKVGTVSDANPYSAPSGLDIWSPSNGSLIVLPTRSPR